MIDPASARPGIYVVSPVYGATCFMPYVTGLLSLQHACHQAGIGFTHFYVSGTALLHEHRNVCAAAFMHHSDLSHMLFVDADVGFEGEDILRMFNERQDVILGTYPAKHINWSSVIAAARREPPLSPDEIANYTADYTTNFYGLDGSTGFIPGQLNEIHSGGAGLMLISRSALTELERCYPEAQSNFPASYKNLVSGIDTLVEYFAFDREPNGRLLSEDITFCKRWREIGGKIFAAPWVRSVHVGAYYFQGNLPRLLGES